MAENSTPYQFKTVDDFLIAQGYLQPQKPFNPSVDDMMGNRPESSAGIDGFEPRTPTGPTHSFAPTNNERINQICATCANDYSIAFEVRDADNRLCAGMYYTVWCDARQFFHQGITDKNGLTERYVSPYDTDYFYLYLGHRDRKKDGYPLDQNDAPHAAENKVDEAPLWKHRVMPYSEKKIVHAKTKRKWKPFKASDHYKNSLLRAEGDEPYEYESDEGGNHSIGRGHKLTNDEMRHHRFDQGYWAQPLSEAKMEELQDEDIHKNGGATIDREVFVPLYEYEVDAILDLGYNGGRGALSANAASAYTHNGEKNPPNTERVRLEDLINSGRYDLAAKYFQDHYNTEKGKGWTPGMANRRDMDMRLFSGDKKNGYTNLGHHTKVHPTAKD